MDMNRRNVLIGLGTAAVGTGAAFGSGAFTQVEADRTVSVGVADDSNAHVGLVPNADVAGAVTTSGGDLEIKLDSSLGNGNGVNRNASIRVSNETDPTINGSISAESDNGFKIVNQNDSAVSIDLEVDSADAVELNAHYYEGTDGLQGAVTDNTQAGTFNGGEIDSGLAAGDEIAVAITVETGGGDVATNPVIRVRATN